jgi:glycosyltransferase involved in cell wall biosynthesis
VKLAKPAPPLVSVITPTWHRHDWLVNRCMASVEAQTYVNVEHVIVSDGPDLELQAILDSRMLPAGRLPIKFEQLDSDHRGGQWGAAPRRRALELATGGLIAYLDDDDSFRPRHCEVLVEALAAHPDAGFAYTQMASHGQAIEDSGGTIIGSADLGPCQIGTPMIMHRRELLELANWGPPDSMEDWRLIDRWLLRGVTAYFVPEVTVDVWPSAYRGGTP